MGERKSNLREFKAPDHKILEKFQISGEAVMVSGIYRLEHNEKHPIQEELLAQKGICLPSCGVCRKPIRFHLIQAINPINKDPDFP